MMNLNYNVNLNDLTTKNTRKSELRDMMDGFVASGSPAAEIDWNGNYASVTTAYSCLNGFLHRNPNYNVKVIRKGEKIYLMSTANAVKVPELKVATA